MTECNECDDNGCKGGFNENNHVRCHARGRSGNALHSCKQRDNFATNFVKHCRHQPDCEFEWRGTGWSKLIDLSPSYDEVPRKKAKIEHKNSDKDSFPTITHHNCLRQALRWNKEHNLNSTDLWEVMEHMTRVGNWQPDPKCIKEGLTWTHHALYKQRASQAQMKTLARK
jgi:hypothetical protein